MIKKNIKVAALSLLLVGMATSCQKDGEMDPSQELSQNLWLKKHLFSS